MRISRIVSAFCLLVVILAACTPAETAMPPASPIATPRLGWHALQNGEFELWVPDSFIGGTNANIDSVILRLSQVGPTFAKAAESIKQQGPIYVLFAVDTNAQNRDKVTNLIVGREMGGANVDIHTYLENLVTNLLRTNSQYHLLAKDIDSTSRYPTGRIIAQSGGVTQIMYAVKGNGAFWQIVFTTPASELEGRLPIFDQIAHSVSLQYYASGSGGTRQSGSPIVFLVGVAIVAVALAVKGFARPRVKEPLAALPDSTESSGADGELASAPAARSATQRRSATKKAGDPRRRTVKSRGKDS